MRRLVVVAFAVAGLVLAARIAAAQQQEPPPLPATPIVMPAAALQAGPLSQEQQKELQKWLDNITAWQRQERRWQNGPAHNNYGKIVERQDQPAPPEWLPGYCTSVVVTRTDSHAPKIERACGALRQLSADPEAESIRQKTAALRADHEKIHKSTFFSRVHLDGLWSTTSTDLGSYGLVGSHISLVDVGRVQLFGPPGILVLRMPDTKVRTRSVSAIRGE